MSEDGEEFARRRIGTTIRGKYKIDSLLGMGGMAVVYVATHRNLAEFAIKMLHPELSLHSEIRQRFLREGYAANAVKHPGVVKVVDDDVAEDGAAFLVMELLEGEPVDAVWERRGRKLPVEVAACVLDQLLDVLGAAHERGIVHRDIKPANIFITKDGTLKVLDFGIARVRDVVTTSAAHLTSSGVLLGTPAFMAPEQALARTSEIEARTDQFAAGAAFFTLVSGRYIHEADNAQQMLVTAATKPVVPIRSLVPDLPPAIAAVVDRSLAFDRAARWPSAGEMRAALREAYLATFGTPPSKDVLAGSVVVGRASARPPVPPSSSAAAVAATEHASGRGRTLPLSALSADAARTPAITGPTPELLLGGTTAQPISLVPATARAEAPAARSRGPVLLGLGAVGLVLVGVSAAVVVPRVLGGGKSAATVSDLPGVPSAASSAPAGPSSVLAATSSTTAGPSAMASASSSSVFAAPSAAPSAKAAPAAAAGRPRPAVAPSSSAAITAASVAPKVEPTPASETTPGLPAMNKVK